MLTALVSEPTFKKDFWLLFGMGMIAWKGAGVHLLGPTLPTLGGLCHLCLGTRAQTHTLPTPNLQSFARHTAFAFLIPST